MGGFGWREIATRGVLVAGRPWSVAGLTRAGVIALCETIAAIGERAGASIVAIPADADLSDETCADDDVAMCSVYVGLLVAEGGTREPLDIPRAAMLAALKQAEAVPEAIWDEIGAACEEAGGEEDDALAEGTLLRLCCTGGLPAARLVFGVLGKEGGLPIGACSVDSPALPIDVGDEAHAPRAGKVKDGAYYLIAEHG